MAGYAHILNGVNVFTTLAASITSQGAQIGKALIDQSKMRKGVRLRD
jgi:hypothetical protein